MASEGQTFPGCPPSGPPAIQGARIRHLADLGEDWDSYGGHPPTEAALAVLGALHVVPLHDGGLQVEWHVNGWDVEIEIAPDGAPRSFFSERREAPDGE